VGLKIESNLNFLFAWLSKRMPNRASAVEPSKNWKVAIQAFAGFLIIVVTLNNLDSVNALTLPSVAQSVVRFFYMDQNWNMFAPYPMKNDGWFVIEGQFQNGDHFDLWSGKSVTYEKPILPSAAYPSSEWRKFMVTVWDDSTEKILLPFARYLCRRYSTNEGYASNVSTLHVNFVKETTPEPGKPFGPTEVIKLWSHDCFAT
jgi:hypothetical protein